jgi:hypothetical protein
MHVLLQACTPSTSHCLFLHTCSTQQELGSPSAADGRLKGNALHMWAPAFAAHHTCGHSQPTTLIAASMLEQCSLLMPLLRGAGPMALMLWLDGMVMMNNPQPYSAQLAPCTHNICHAPTHKMIIYCTLSLQVNPASQPACFTTTMATSCCYCTHPYQQTCTKLLPHTTPSTNTQQRLQPPRLTSNASATAQAAAANPSNSC